MPDVKLMLGDCLEQLKLLPDNSIDAVVTDRSSKVIKT